MGCSIKVVITVVVTIALLNCANPETRTSPHRTPVNLEGIWYSYSKDSVYQEILFTDSVLWAVSPAFGDLYRDLSVRGDTIVYLGEGEEFARQIIKVVNDSTFVMADEDSTVFRRVTPLLTKAELRLILIGDSNMRARYFDAYNQRGNYPVMR